MTAVEVDVAVLQEQVEALTRTVHDLRAELREFKKSHEELKRDHDGLVNKGMGAIMVVSLVGYVAGIFFKKLGL
jgi:prefoldin subunit 5